MDFEIMFGEWLGQEVRTPYVDPEGKYGFNTYDISPFAYTQAMSSGSNAVNPVPSPPITSLYQCSADYVKKYTARFGHAPVFCGPTRVIENPPYTACAPGWELINGQCVVVEHPNPPIVPIPVTPPIPVPARRRRRARPHPPHPGDMCPIQGYVSRAIPGVNEYQNFKCTPGQPVDIDPGLARAGAAGAYARAGMPMPAWVDVGAGRRWSGSRSHGLSGLGHSHSQCGECLDRCTSSNPCEVESIQRFGRTWNVRMWQPALAGLGDVAADSEGDSLPTWMLAGVLMIGLVMFSKGGRRRR